MEIDINLSQFHDIFFEESFEGIEIMESELLNLSPGTADREIINTIFRAAHSIKGSAGTFGFSEISDFTHKMETVLDKMRNDLDINAAREIKDKSPAVLFTTVAIGSFRGFIANLLFLRSNRMQEERSCQFR